MHGRHFIFEDLAFVVDLHLRVFAKFAVNSVTDLLQLIRFAKFYVKCRDILCSLWIARSKFKLIEA